MFKGEEEIKQVTRQGLSRDSGAQRGADYGKKFDDCSVVYRGNEQLESGPSYRNPDDFCSAEPASYFSRINSDMCAYPLNASVVPSFDGRPPHRSDVPPWENCPQMQTYFGGLPVGDDNTVQAELTVVSSQHSHSSGKHGDRECSCQQHGASSNYHEPRKTDRFHQVDNEVAVKCGCRFPHLSDSSCISDSTDSSNDYYGDGHQHCRCGRGGGRQRYHKSRKSRASRDHYGARERQRPHDASGWIKPEKFNGHGSFETFLVPFENCASYNRWSSSDKVAYLRWSLTGAAAQLLWGSEGVSYEELLDKLKTRFSGKGMEEKFQSELRCRRRNRGESLRELAHDVRRLMTLAYPGEQSNLSEHIARDAFLSALGDPEFELKIRKREPWILTML